MGDDLDAVIRHFPARIRTIEALAASDEEFVTLCADLMVCEAEALKWQATTDRQKEERVVEYQTLANELAKEIEAALDAAVVVRFPVRTP